MPAVLIRKLGGTYEQAVAAVRSGAVDGIGFCLLNSNYGAFDLDHCHDPATGALTPRMQELVARVPSGAYVEVTVSGKGLRIIGECTGDYITISGKALNGYGDGPLPNIDELFVAVRDECDAIKKGSKTKSSKSGAKPGTRSLPGYLTAILHLADRGAGQKHGDYDTRSEALFGFINGALRIGIDENAIVAALLDPKYENCGVYEHCHDQGGDDYVKRQIAKAMNDAEALEKKGQKQIIKISPGNRHEAWRATQKAMIAARCQVYQRGGVLVEPQWVWQEMENEGRGVLVLKLVKYNLSCLSDQADHHAVEFQRFNEKEGRWKPINAPRDVMETLLTRGD
jgi:hypothetical protein